MTFRRVALLFVIALILEVGVFAFSYDDLIFLRRSSEALLSQPPAAFESEAKAALTRSKLTRRHLETIAQASQRMGMTSIEVTALERLTHDAGTEAGPRLRFADALRRAGDFSRSERVYLDVLTSIDAGAR